MSALRLTILQRKQNVFPTRVLLKSIHMKKCYKKTAILQSVQVHFRTAVLLLKSLCFVVQARPQMLLAGESPSDFKWRCVAGKIVYTRLFHTVRVKMFLQNALPLSIFKNLHP